MQYRPLGRSGLNVSVVCLGSMTWGQQNNQADADQQLDFALANGVNFIDVAEMYPVPPMADTQGATERILGDWLQRRGGRGELILASKVTGRSDFDWIRGGPRLSREHVDQAVTDSLKRLQTDYIDLYQVHWPERSTNFFGKLGYRATDDTDAIAIEVTLEALARHVEAGRIRQVGISNETPWGVAEYLRLADSRGLPRVASIQNPYSLLNRSYEVGLAEFAHREQVGLLAYSPLAFGVLSGKYLGGARPAGSRLSLFDRFQRYTGEQAERITGQYVDLAARHDLDPAQMALAYVHSRPFVTATIIGATTMTQLQADVNSIDLELPAAVLEGIEAIHRACSNPCP